MPAGTEQTGTTKSQVRDAPQALPAAEQKQSAHSGGDHGGIFSRMHEVVAASGACSACWRSIRQTRRVVIRY
jgi:hypothetical protein